MSNRAVWTVRKRHEWLTTPTTKKRLKRRKRLRIGLEAALLRRAEKGIRCTDPVLERTVG
jgi:hypothetical protein